MVDRDIEKKLDARPADTAEPSVLEQSPGEADRLAYEELPETKDAFLEQESAIAEKPSGESRTGEKATLTPPPVVTPSPPPLQKSVTTVRVEKIMEEGLGDLYRSLPEDAKGAFKAKGEEIAEEIAGMMKDVKLRISRVVRLLREWLMTIPKANRFFLEQEAKIKADKIVEFFQDQKAERTEKKNQP